MTCMTFSAGATTMPTNTAESKYKAGQVWSYKTRPSEDQSTLTIVKVETDPAFGTIVHISIQGCRIKNPKAPKGYTDVIPHMPFSEDAIDHSVVKLLRTNVPLPEFQRGYEEWRRAKGGVFTTSVAEGIEFAERALSH